MKSSLFRLSLRLLTGLCILSACGFAFAQTSPGPINIDQALRAEAPPEPDRAASYYHYVLAKEYESNGDSENALSEMRTALAYNPTSSAIHYELAVLHARFGRISEATRYANESVKLDHENPDPRWLLTNIHLNQPRRGGGMAAVVEGLRQAAGELEVLEKLTPEDENVYFMLGSIYFELGEVEKAIAAFERHQKHTGTDDGYREIARYYINANDLDRAIEYLDKGLELQPDSSESLRLLGNIYLNQGKNREAAEVIKKLFDTSSGNAPVMSELASILFEAKDYREAAGIVERLMERVRPDRVSHIILGRSYLELGRYSDAIRIFDEVLSRIPDDVEARFHKGEAYAGRGRHEDAAKIYEELLLDRSPEARNNHAIFIDRLAGVRLTLENYDGAIDLYEEIVESNPRAYFQLLEAYRVSRRYDRGLALGKEYLAKNPDDIFGSIVYARMLADAGRHQEGAEFLSRLLERHPNDIVTYINLSEIYIQDKRYADAEKILLRAEERRFSPEEIERLRFHRASVYERQKSYDPAEKLFREIIEKQPDNASALNYLGYMLADRGVRLDEAVRYISEALKIEPENGAYLDSLGWAYFKLGDIEKAEKYLLEAVSIVPNDSTILDHLGDLYFKLGQFEKARDYWERSERIGAIRSGKDAEELQEVRRKLKQVEETLRKKR